MTGITAHPYAVPLATPYRWARGEQLERRGPAGPCRCCPPAKGWGEAAPPIHETHDTAALAREVDRLCAGLDVAADDFLARLDQPATRIPRLRCGIATAWLSAQAMAQRRCRCRATWAGTAWRLRGAGQWPGDGGDARRRRIARAAALAADGTGTLKIKCTADRGGRPWRGSPPSAHAVPQAARLRLDANESWHPRNGTLDHLHAMAQHGIEYVEQPLPQTASLDRLASLRRDSPIPVAWDESARDLADNRVLAAGMGRPTC